MQRTDWQKRGMTTHEVNTDAELDRENTNSSLVELGQLAAGIAHDFGNVVSTICSYSQLLQARTDLSFEAEEDVHALSNSARRALDLVNRLRNWSAVECDSPVTVEVIELCRSVIADHQKSFTGKKLCFSSDVSEAFVQVNRALLERAILNLLCNAHEAMNFEGVIDLRVASRDEMLHLSIIDRGCGVPPAMRARVLRPFVSSKRHGTGLGLANVKQFSDAAGGQFVLEDNPQGGTIARIQLPLVEQSPELLSGIKQRGDTPESVAFDDLKDEDQLSGVRAIQSFTVLLCSEDEDLNSGLEKLLETYGFTVVSCPSAGEALLAAEQYPASLSAALLFDCTRWLSSEEFVGRIKSLRPQMHLLLASDQRPESLALVERLDIPLNPQVLVTRLRKLRQEQTQETARAQVI